MCSIEKAKMCNSLDFWLSDIFIGSYFFFQCTKETHRSRNGRRKGDKRGTGSFASKIERRTFRSLVKSRTNCTKSSFSL